MVDGRTYWKRNMQDAWYRAKEEGKLTTRVVMGLWAYPDDSDEDLIAALKELQDLSEEQFTRDFSNVSEYVKALKNKLAGKTDFV